MALNHAYINGRRGLNPVDFITPNDPSVQGVAGSIITKIGPEASPQDRLKEAYNYVTANIKYVTDKTHWGYTEVWQMPDETLKRGLGDCEDSSFLLCSLLLALGVNARVVFGTWQEKGHAWVEAQIDGTGGILETTSGQPFTGFADPTAYGVEGTFSVPGPEDPFLAFLVYIAPGLILFTLGAYMMIDDAKDAFKIVSTGRLLPWDPATEGVPHVHHWMTGIILVILAIMLLALGAVLWMLKYL